MVPRPVVQTIWSYKGFGQPHFWHGALSLFESCFWITSARIRSATFWAAGAFHFLFHLSRLYGSSWLRPDILHSVADTIESYKLFFFVFSSRYNMLYAYCCGFVEFFPTLNFLAFSVGSCLVIVIRLASLVSSLAIDHSIFTSLTGTPSFTVVCICA